MECCLVCFFLFLVIGLVYVVLFNIVYLFVFRLGKYDWLGLVINWFVLVLVFDNFYVFKSFINSVGLFGIRRDLGLRVSVIFGERIRVLFNF